MFDSFRSRFVFEGNHLKVILEELDWQKYKKKQNRLKGNDFKKELFITRIHHDKLFI